MIREILIAPLLLCAIASAQPGHSPNGPAPHGPSFERSMPGHMLLPPGRWWKDAAVAQRLSLTPTQVQKIEQIFQESRFKLIDAHANLQKEEFKLEPLLEADAPDEGAVLTSIDRIAGARATLEKANAQMAFAIRRTLTPEQWKKLRTLHPARRNDFPPPDAPHERRLQPKGPAPKQGFAAPRPEEGEAPHLGWNEMPPRPMTSPDAPREATPASRDEAAPDAPSALPNEAPDTTR